MPDEDLLTTSPEIYFGSIPLTRQQIIPHHAIYDGHPTSHASFRPRLRLEGFDDDGSPVLDPGSGGLIVVMPDPEHMTSLGHPTRHFGIGASPSLDARAHDDGNIPLSQRYLQLGAKGEQLKDFFDSVIWPLSHDDSNLPLAYLSQLAQSQDVTVAEAARTAWGTYLEATRLAAQQLAKEINEGEIFIAHDKHFIMLPLFLYDELVAIGKDVTRISINWFDHTPWPDVESLKASFHFPDDPEVLDSVIPEMFNDMFRSLNACDWVGFQVGPYVSNFHATYEHFMGQRDAGRAAPIVAGNHVQFDSAAILDGIFENTDAQEARDVQRLRREGIGDDAFVITCASRLDPEKGLLELLDGFYTFLSNNRSDPKVLKSVHLHLRIPDSRPKKYIDFKTTVKARIDQIIRDHRSWCTDAGVQPHADVIFRTDKNSRSAFLAEAQMADVRIFPSPKDGYNISSEEAAYVGGSGIVAVSRGMGVASDPASDSWIKFDASDPNDIARAIEDAYQMPRAERRRRLEQSVESFGVQHPAFWQQEVVNTAIEAAAQKRAAGFAIAEMFAATLNLPGPTLI